MELPDYSQLKPEQVTEKYLQVKARFEEIRGRYPAGNHTQQEAEELDKYMAELLGLIASPTVQREIQQIGKKDEMLL